MYIVGAGCGDFDLITMRGAEYIRHCDVLVYDSLIDSVRYSVSLTSLFASLILFEIPSVPLTVFLQSAGR